ncbi:MAG: lamin tail domain-containing protein, partial [Bacteroidaceae bacterium]|nr:lamin tail domain-containing protein [Bacteroidaceae bacterium]
MMRKTILIYFLLFAGWSMFNFQCSMAFAQEFILPMGYQEPWTGKLLFNSEGGYNTGGNHAWEQLYEAQKEDIYTITMPTACYDEAFGLVQFKTPITFYADHSYRFIMSLESDKEIPNVHVALCENGNDNYDDNCLVSAFFNLPANKKATFTRNNLPGTDIEDAMISLGFPTTEDDVTITLSGISIYDLTDGRELWTGTSFYNWCYYADEEGERIPDMRIDGRNETLSWTQADFDDSEWAEAMMPIGSLDVSGVQTEWPLGDNTNFWFRRNFTLEEIHEKSRYMLNVLHDDSYRIWVNGELLDEANDWTVGTNAVKLEIPASLLQEGNNVIAAYVQQNWGGKLYDCGLTEEENFYEDYDPDADLSKLLINEIQVGNIDQYIDYSYNYGAWAEFYNPTAENIQLDGLYVSDDINDPFKFQLPTGTGVVKAGDYKVIYFDHNSADGTFGDTAYKQVRFKLDSDGGTLYLFDTDGSLLASADYPELITRCSWARMKDGSKEWG